MTHDSNISNILPCLHSQVRVAAADGLWPPSFVATLAMSLTVGRSGLCHVSVDKLH